MKSTEVPNRIYCESDGLGNIVKVHNIKWPDDEAENIEYTRTDIFIEKTGDAYCKACNKPSYSVPIPFCRRRCESYNNFIKNIKL